MIAGLPTQLAIELHICSPLQIDGVNRSIFQAIATHNNAVSFEQHRGTITQGLTYFFAILNRVNKSGTRKIGVSGAKTAA